MRTFEVLLVVLLAVLAVLCALAPLPRKNAKAVQLGLWTLAVIALLTHAILEGVHWQMAPAYLGVLLFAVTFAIREQRSRRVVAGLMFVLAAGSCALSAFLPMFRLPAPTGPYLIGTQILHLVNGHPPPHAVLRADGTRELMVQVWYPAAPSNTPRAPYRKLSETSLLSTYQSVLWTHARLDAPFATDGSPFPLLLLDPEWNGRRTYFTYLVEELVSHGYVVVGIDHTGNSGPTAFPDGHVSQPDPDPGLDFESHTFDELNGYGAQQLAVQVNDALFVLDQMQTFNQDSSNWLHAHLDMNRVGAFGHSFGGSVSAEACREDSRIKSALDMDGSLWGPVQQLGLAKPFMMIEEDVDLSPPPEQIKDHGAMISHLFDLSDAAMMRKSEGFHVTVHGSTHSSFTDRSLYSPLKRYSGEGDIPADREYMIIRQYVLAFFDKTLNGKDSPLLDEANHPFRETSMEILHRP
jgi:predicted dienelactone hydrolase